VSTAAKMRRTCSEVGKERKERRKTRAQTRHKITNEHQIPVFLPRMYST
jgi:hypothetical protein